MHFDIHLFEQWLLHYGSFALAGFLALGIFGLPIPDDTLLALASYLMTNGKLSSLTTIPAAYIGSMAGITLSYILGYTAGRKVIIQLGRYIGITQEKLEKAHQWYERFGKW